MFEEKTELTYPIEIKSVIPSNEYFISSFEFLVERHTFYLILTKKDEKAFLRLFSLSHSLLFTSSSKLPIKSFGDLSFLAQQLKRDLDLNKIENGTAQVTTQVGIGQKLKFDNQKMGFNENLLFQLLFLKKNQKNLIDRIIKLEYEGEQTKKVNENLLMRITKLEQQLQLFTSNKEKHRPLQETNTNKIYIQGIDKDSLNSTKYHYENKILTRIKGTNWFSTKFKTLLALNGSIYKKKIQILKTRFDPKFSYGSIMFGVVSANYRGDVAFESHKSWLFYLNALRPKHRLLHNKSYYQNYGVQIKPGDYVEITLDTNAHTLSLKVNEENFGVAFNNIDIDVVLVVDMLNSGNQIKIC
ncbi:spry domain-containing socs box protein [Anaeramoeba flamelloides]|uniref:Spry domain-containing socs box protein n=1 Tax=Anaeramoeba flamelloides TaxID=1746091 RepID=A0AAV7ZGK2_9EUKA|nr:spry domain-containing socs box protein [Anaeramoeba flamelloides]